MKKKPLSSLTDAQILELVEALKELTDNAEQACQWMPHVLLIHAVERGRNVLSEIEHGFDHHHQS